MAVSGDTSPNRIPNSAATRSKCATATRGNGVTVDNAHVLKTDIVATNGVIHVIDAVLLPKDK